MQVSVSVGPSTQLSVDETKVTSDGSVSVTTTPTPAEGPLLVTVTV